MPTNLESAGPFGPAAPTCGRSRRREGLRAVAPSTIVQSGFRGASSLAALADLVRGVPSYALELSPDPAANARRRRSTWWPSLAEPVITAAIPVRDGEAYLAEAIESVLAQSRPCEQLIVVDNGSTDRSAEIAPGYGPAVELVEEPRAGIGAARNAALRAARGESVAFLDADDLWEPEKTALQLAAFEADPS